MNEIVKINAPELLVIDKSKAEQIKKTFEPMVKMLDEFENDYQEIMKIPLSEMTLELTKQYKRLRLSIGKVRIETGKLKDKQKEYIKLEDKAIMGVHNILVWAVKEKEDKLKERENYFEIQEKKRLEKLQTDRAEKLSKYVEDAFERDLSKFEDDEFEALLQMKKQAYEDRIEAEKKAKQERIAKEKEEKAEQERIIKENERLKKEAELAEAKRIKEENERIRLAKIEAEKLEAERKEQERIIKENEAKANKLAAELEAKKQAEIKAENDRLAKIEADAKKGDVVKLRDLINDLNIIKTKYQFKSKKNQKMYANVSILIDKLINHIEK